MAEQRDLSWMVPIEVMLGSLLHGQVQACSISSVTDEVRDPNHAAFKPKEVSVGPLHRGTTRHVQLMEETKWLYMREFLNRQGTGSQNRRSEERLRECGNDILKLEKIIIASYGGNIESEPQELAKIMIVDGCFLLELLIRLGNFISSQNSNCNGNSNNSGSGTGNGSGIGSYLTDPIIKNKEKMVSVLNDITMLENQIPFIVLKKLYRKVFPDGSNIDNDQRVANIVRKAFGYPEANDSGGVHILHLMHLSTVEQQNQQEGKRVKKELLRCAARLEAAGITIEAASANTTTRHNLVDWFNFDIKFVDGVLQIPPLYIKETTEVRWRNLIAWEQSKIWISSKYTSYALFFQGLVCCKHDIELLEERGVLVNEARKSKQELLNLFRTIANGAEHMDSSYEVISESLNKYRRKTFRTVLQELPLVTWHKSRHVFQIIAYLWGNWYRILIRDHIPTVWKFIGVLAAVALLVLTIMQTYYASRGTQISGPSPVPPRRQ